MRLFLLFALLFACGLAGLMLLPMPAKQVVPPTASAAPPPRVDPDLAEAGRSVRVVYPPSNPADAPSPQPAAPAAGNVPPPPPSAPAAVATVPGPQPTAPPVSVSQPNADAVPPATGKTDINTASVADLDRIPGGGKIGRAIASRRPYASIDDLKAKRVLRSSVFEQIKDHIAVQ